MLKIPLYKRIIYDTCKVCKKVIEEGNELKDIYNEIVPKICKECFKEITSSQSIVHTDEDGDYYTCDGDDCGDYVKVDEALMIEGHAYCQICYEHYEEEAHPF